jgi:hypothetical protein
MGKVKKQKMLDDPNLAIPANALCASGLAWDVGPAPCFFLSERESEAGSSETTHFARGPWVLSRAREARLPPEIHLVFE